MLLRLRMISAPHHFFAERLVQSHHHGRKIFLIAVSPTHSKAIYNDFPQVRPRNLSSIIHPLTEIARI